MRTAIFSLIFLCALNELQAQDHFHVTVQSFSQAKQDWGDTTIRHSFWKNASGVLDSMWTYQGANSRVYKDWVKVTTHTDRLWLSRFPTDFVQYATTGRMPRRTEHYVDNGLGILLQGYDSVVVLDSLVTDYMYTSPGLDNWMAYRFGYTEYGELASLRTEIFSGDSLEVQTSQKVERERDSIGRVVEARSYTLMGNEFIIMDSERFVYNEDNTLRTAYVTYKQSGIAIAAYQVEFVGWQDYAAGGFDMDFGEIMVGGTRYKARTTHGWDESDTTFHLVERHLKQYNDQGLLMSDYEHYGGASNIRVLSYYPNGDVLEVKEAHASFSDTLTSSRTMVNTYANDGRILVSELFASGHPISRHTFEYPGRASVRSDPSDANLASFGRILRIPCFTGNQHVSIVNTLGASVFTGVKNAYSLDVSHLPSGLYFISIDGGRPRKHLVP